MRLKTTLLASAAGAAVLATVPVAQAGGSYISVFGGWNKPINDIASLAGTGSTSFSTVVTVGPPTTPVTGTITFNFNTTFAQSGAKARDGFVLGAAVGGDLSHWLKGLRGEVELAYRRSKFGRASAAAAATATPPTDTATFSGVTFTTTLTAIASASPSGELRTFTLMANAWYDFDMGNQFTPYVGGGVGYADNEIKHGILANGTAGDFAWQLGAGVNYRINEGMAIGLGYRYLDAGDVEILHAPRLGGNVPTSTYEVTSHNVLVNMNFKIGQ
jgi:opacity protein-like surface antigen